MKKIYKYPLEFTNYQTLQLPRGAKVISAINQRDQIMLYAIVDTAEQELTTVEVSFEVVVQPTGLAFENIDAYQFLSTVSLNDARYVFHLFYRQL